LLDITKSMEQQKALEHLEQKYAKLIDRTETAFVELSQDDEVLSYNSQFADMAGEKGGDGLKGQKISKWLPEAYSLREHLENKDEGSGKKGFRLKMHTHTGLTKSLSARAEMIGPGSKGGNNIYAFLTDISREEELEQRVRQSNEQYQQLFEASKDGIVSAGTDKRITNANQAFLDIVGYALEEIREMHYSEFTHEGSIAKDEDVMQNQVAVRGYSEEYEKEYVRKDGSTVPVSLKIVSLNDKMGKTVQFWAIVRDISEKKRQERKLQEANENLQEMIYIASHDLQVPLISMESFASELLEEHSDKLGEEGKYALLRVKKNAERMHNLVISLLNMSRLNTHENPFVPLNMKALAEQVINDLSLTMNEAGACITLEKLPLCIGDKTRITTLFRNLLTNSINYGAKRILIGHREGRYFVEDNGIGIPPDQLERVFKPGERLKMNQAEGVGMGLTFCKKVVQKHEGRIWAESDGEGRGATIYFTLPMKNETKRNDHEQIHRHIANGRR
jgi:PAS domain S-box-containing protein